MLNKQTMFLLSCSLYVIISFTLMIFGRQSETLSQNKLHEKPIESQLHRVKIEDIDLYDNAKERQLEGDVQGDASLMKRLQQQLQSINKIITGSADISMNNVIKNSDQNDAKTNAIMEKNILTVTETNLGANKAEEKLTYNLGSELSKKPSRAPLTTEKADKQRSAPAEIPTKPSSTKKLPSAEIENQEFSVDVATAAVVKELTHCPDKKLTPFVKQRGDFFVLNNYIVPEIQFGCADAVTYATHGDYSFLDNLIPLVERWRGPVSLTLYAPGADFNMSLKSALYMRQCNTPLIKKLVNFNFYFDVGHFPEKIPTQDELSSMIINCSDLAPYINVNASSMYKAIHNLVYPVNVARNVARQNAQTRYVLVSDIELYPSPDIGKKFLKMLARRETEIKPKRVYPLHVYEIKEDAVMPMTKSRLKEMLHSKEAIPFHEKVCWYCHGLPNNTEWLALNDTGDMHVLVVASREGTYQHWEPIYIGTDDEPLYDERLSWDGKSDKIIQSFIMCTMKYEFAVLDSGFLVHRPGIKTFSITPQRSAQVAKTNGMKYKIIAEVQALYGNTTHCAI